MLTAVTKTRSFRVGLILLACLLANVTSASAELLVFTAPWCRVCRLMDNTTHRMLDEGFPVREVNVDDHPELTQQHRVRGVPTLILIRDQREVQRSEGPLSYAQLLDWFKTAGIETANPRRPTGAQDTIQREAATPRLESAVAAPDASNSTRSVDRQDPATRAADRALRATVRLKVEDSRGHSYGTGTVIDVNGQHALVVTCGHIFRESQGAGAIAVDTFATGRPLTVPGTIVGYDLDQDIALVSIALSGPVERVPVALHVQSIQRQDRVFSIGCNHGAEPTVAASHIVDINRYLDVENLLVHGHPVDGRSGGGLFNERGELIGICNAADHERDEGLFASLPVIHRILDRFNLSVAYQRQPQTESHPSVAEGGPATRSRSEGSSSERMSFASNTRPGFETDRGGPTQPSTRSEADRTAVSAPRASNGVQGETEVICIVRSRHGDQAAEPQVFVMDRASEAVLDAIRREGRPQANRVR